MSNYRDVNPEADRNALLELHCSANFGSETPLGQKDAV